RRIAKHCLDELNWLHRRVLSIPSWLVELEHAVLGIVSIPANTASPEPAFGPRHHAIDDRLVPVVVIASPKDKRVFDPHQPLPDNPAHIDDREEEFERLRPCWVRDVKWRSWPQRRKTKCTTEQIRQVGRAVVLDCELVFCPSDVINAIRRVSPHDIRLLPSHQAIDIARLGRASAKNTVLPEHPKIPGLYVWLLDWGRCFVWIGQPFERLDDLTPRQLVEHRQNRFAVGLDAFQELDELLVILPSKSTNWI